MGAGKTAVARALVAAPRKPTVYIEGDRFWPFIVKGLGVRNQDFRASMRAMLGAAIAYARSDLEAVLDFSIPPPFFAAYTAKVKKTEFHYVVLKPSLDVCAARAASRKDGAILDYDDHRDFYDLFETDDRHMIRDDESDPEDLAERIKAGIASGLFRA